MKTLILETASSHPIVVLADDARVIGEIRFSEPKELSSKLFLELFKLLEQEDLTLHDIKILALGVGPGSYTGVRIGATFCKTASYAINLPIIPFCSLEAFIPPVPSDYLVAIDARSQGLYLARGASGKDGQPHLIETPHLVPFEQAKQLSASISQLLSPDADLLAKRCGETLFSKAVPDSAHLAKLVYQLYKEDRALSWDSLNLTYLSSPATR